MRMLISLLGLDFVCSYKGNSFVLDWALYVEYS